MSREDRQAVEQPQPGRERLGEADDHRARVRCGDVERLAVDGEGGGERAGHARVVRGAKRKEHVGGGERRAVGEAQARLERDGVGSGRRPTSSTRSASHGSSSSVARLTRTSRAWVRKRHHVGGRRRARGDVPVVGRGLGSNRRDERPAASRLRARRRRDCGGVSVERQPASGDTHDQERRRARIALRAWWPRMTLTGQFLGRSPNLRK